MFRNEQHIAREVNGFFFNKDVVKVYLNLQNRSIAYYRETHLYASQILAVAIANGKLNFPSSVILVLFVMHSIDFTMNSADHTNLMRIKFHCVRFEGFFSSKNGFCAKEMFF